MSLLTSSFSLTSSDYFIPEDSESIQGNSQSKLGTFLGVATPTILAIYGVVLFQRLGFAIGQAGWIQCILLFGLGYSIMILTSLSLAAVATNGRVGKGGAYYLISRVLGPEFGGSIGCILYVATIFNTAFNVAGLVEALLGLFGVDRGSISNVLPNAYAWQLLYGSLVLLFCLLVCLVGAQLFAKTSLVIFVLLLFSIASVIISIIAKGPEEYPSQGVVFTGISSSTLADNAGPGYSDGYNFIQVFGIVFPACTGFLAGAAMSGDLADPSKAIPRGTLGAVGFTGIGYLCLMFLIGASVDRDTLKYNYNYLQKVCFNPVVLGLGVGSATLSGALSNLIGASRLIQAIAIDKLVPGLGLFTRTYGKNDEPLMAVLISWLLVQGVLVIGDINKIAPFVTLFFLLCYATTNLAVVGPALASTPNWRPTFKYYRWWLSALGALTCLIAMFMVDPMYASISVALCLVLFLGIFVSKPSSAQDWGDLTQALTFHQVRKHVLRLDTRHDHVKNWRPHLLFLCPSPRQSFALARFLNALKKGGIYSLGHVLPADDASLGAMYSVLGPVWQEFVDASKLKAFIDFAAAGTVREGARQLMLTSGLGAVKCNTVILAWPGPESGALPAGSMEPRTPTPGQQRGEREATEEERQFDEWLKAMGNAQMRSRRLARLRPKRQARRGNSAASGALRSMVGDDDDGFFGSDEADARSPLALGGASSPIEARLSVLSHASFPGPDPLQIASPSEYVSMIRDAALLMKNCGIGRNFGGLAERLAAVRGSNSKRVIIDLWPVRPHPEAAAALSGAPSSRIPSHSRQASVHAASMRNVSLVLQMGSVLSRSAALRPVQLRVFGVVGSEEERLTEDARLRAYVAQLRITATVNVVVVSDVPGAFPQRNADDDDLLPPGSVSTDDLVASVSLPTFDSLNNQEQCAVLNELIRVNSQAAAVVIATMPPCPTEADVSRDARYMQALDNLTRDVPPIMLLSSGPAATVTTSL